MRMIDADDLRAWLIRAARFLKGEVNHKGKTFVIGKIIDHIDRMPTVDAVEVVRCRDCIHQDLLTCPRNYIEQSRGIFINHDPEAYCSEGEGLSRSEILMRRAEYCDARNARDCDRSCPFWEERHKGSWRTCSEWALNNPAAFGRILKDIEGGGENGN